VGALRPGAEIPAQLPELNPASGVELCRALRSDPATKDLPVILVSGSLTPGDDRPKTAQATAVVSKPFRPRELVDCVAEALGDGRHLR
jgi:CheY-like chemotaxis protein